MNLLMQVIVAAIIVAVILVVVYVGVQSIGLGQHVTELQAVSLVQHDIQNQNPDTLVEITNVTPSQYSGSWHITAAVTYNSTSPCPSYVSYSFDYPKYGFVSTLENNYTSDCVIYGFDKNKSYVFEFGPLAVARSYDLGIPSVNAFVEKFGFSNVTAQATFYNVLNVGGKSQSDVWLVNYSSPRSKYSEFVALTQVNGNLIANYTLSR
ncbi:MAG: hypothetical protein KGH61_03665 [Candidatus Micrarchaeota archaeon]|nr:hypothetical protein [Candidatus Micrarchaeota archaeon]MDE1848020.1 hypothetical protein [Candidatus Micrarchaeota archaeon]MDE1864603.1 hypothetical protein [Candidatus Micrarchaeota archaeon]